MLACEEDSSSGEIPETEQQPTDETPEENESEENENADSQNEVEDSSQTGDDNEETQEDNEDIEDNGDIDEEEGEGDTGDENSENYGTIQLSGDETADVGTTLTVGHIAVGREDLTGTTKSVILTDVNTPITEEGPAPPNLKNGFILIGGDDLDTLSSDGALKDISMIIFIDDLEYRFACSVPADTFIDCGEDYDIDFENKTMVFDSTIVANTETQKVLVLDGNISWK